MKQKRKTKKAMGIEDAGMLLYRLVFLAIAIFVFVTFANMILKPYPDTNEVKTEILLGRVYYSEAIHQVKEFPTLTKKLIDTTVIDVDKLNSYKYKIFWDKVQGMNNAQLNTFIQNPNNKKFMSDDSKLKEFFREQFYNPKRTNLMVFKLIVNYELAEKVELDPNNFDVRKLTDSYERTNEFFSDFEQYVLLEPKTTSKGKGATTTLGRSYYTSCLVNKKVIPCEATLELLIPNS